MPTLPDPARVTIPGRISWRPCASCGLFADLPNDGETCSTCINPTAFDVQRAQSGWHLANLYADAIGRIRAWSDMAGFPDAERLDCIREALAHLDRFHPGRKQQPEDDGCR